MQTHRRTLVDEKTQAELLDCSLRHLINLRNRRLVPHIRLGKLVRYDPNAVQRALEKLTVREVV